MISKSLNHQVVVLGADKTANLTTNQTKEAVVEVNEEVAEEVLPLINLSKCLLVLVVNGEMPRMELLSDNIYSSEQGNLLLFCHIIIL